MYGLMLAVAGCDGTAATATAPPSAPPWLFDDEPVAEGACVDGWQGGVGGLPAGLVEGYAREQFARPDDVVERLAETISGAWSEYEPAVSADAHSLDAGTAVGVFEMRTAPGDPGDATIRLWLRNRGDGWAIFAAAARANCS